MKKILKGETANKSIVINGKVATATNTAKGDKEDAVRYEMVWSFDFSKATQEQIMQLATRSLVIMQQAAWRADDTKNRTKDEKWHNVTFDVANIMANRRKAASPVEKAGTAINKLSDKEKAALIKKLNEELKNS